MTEPKEMTIEQAAELVTNARKFNMPWSSPAGSTIPLSVLPGESAAGVQNRYNRLLKAYEGLRDGWMSNIFTVAIDFDGTIAKHEYPEIGDEVPEAIRWIGQLQSLRTKLILWTMRSGEKLHEAGLWLKSRGIHMDHLNQNPQHWTDSPKAYANVYIDDSALGCPLVQPEDHQRAWVDWNKVGPKVFMRMLERHVELY